MLSWISWVGHRPGKLSNFALFHNGPRLSSCITFHDMVTEAQQANIESKYSTYLSSLQPAYRQGAIRAIIAAEVLADAVNELNFDGKSFAFAVGRQHRTLQQSIVRAFVAVAGELAEAKANGNFDLRNEAACKLAVEISKLKTGMPFV